ncbi:MAG: cytochrome P460 family protein, partial [Acidobacteria bacterium]|nr:cytochrome P460 family protein [Acidobacteriota bacterium]
MNNAIKSVKFFVVAGIALAGFLFSISSPEPAANAQTQKPQSAAAEKPVAVFEGQDTLLRPENYREWVFVGSSTGLNYSPNPAPSSSTAGTDFKNVYINPSSYREFIKTGTFPEGTVMILEIAQAANKNEP